MHIVIVSGLVADSGPPFPVPAMTPTFGFSGYSFLYPEHVTYHVHPKMLRKHMKRYPVDVVMFNPMSPIEPTRAMTDLASALGGRRKSPIFVTLDSDISSHWLLYHPAITDAFLDLFAACDFVICRNDYAVPITQEHTPTPVFWLPEPSTAKTDLRVDELEGFANRNLIIGPSALCSAYNTQRNAMVNHAVMKALMREEPDWRYIVLARDNVAYLEELGGANEPDILRKIGLGAEVWTGFTHLDIYDMFRRAKLMINLDHEPSMGHWQLDAAAFGVPTICTAYTCGGRKLFPNTQVFAYDFAGTLEHANRLLTDEAAWAAESARARKACEFFHADSLRQMFEDGLGIG